MVDTFPRYAALLGRLVQIVIDFKVVLMEIDAVGSGEISLIVVLILFLLEVN